MARETKGPGGCLISVLIILVIAAVFGIINWGIVIKYAKFLGYIILIGILLIAVIGIAMLISMLIRYLFGKFKIQKSPIDKTERSRITHQTASKDTNGNYYKRVNTFSDGRVSITLEVFDTRNRVVKIIGDLGNGHKYSQGYLYDKKSGDKLKGLHQSLGQETDIYELYQTSFKIAQSTDYDNEVNNDDY